MATEKCKDCGNTVSTSAARCPHCGRALKKLITGPRVLILFLAVLLGGLVFLSQRAEKKSAERDASFQDVLRRARESGSDTMGDIYDQVAADAVNQYHIAKRQGDPMQTCVQAGFVTAGYLQAKNEAEYRRWKDIESSDCKRAGVTE